MVSAVLNNACVNQVLVCTFARCTTASLVLFTFNKYTSSFGVADGIILVIITSSADTIFANMLISLLGLIRKLDEGTL